MIKIQEKVYANKIQHKNTITSFITMLSASMSFKEGGQCYDLGNSHAGNRLREVHLSDRLLQKCSIFILLHLKRHGNKSSVCLE